MVVSTGLNFVARHRYAGYSKQEPQLQSVAGKLGEQLGPVILADDKSLQRDEPVA